MIDPATGRILLEGDGALVLDASLPRAVFLTLAKGVASRAVGKTGSSHSFDGRVAGRIWTLSPFFDGEVLQSVGMCYARTRLAEQWSESEEHREKGEYDALLRAAMGNPPHQFAWGRVESFYDDRAGASGLCVYYRRA